YRSIRSFKTASQVVSVTFQIGSDRATTTVASVYRSVASTESHFETLALSGACVPLRKDHDSARRGGVAGRSEQ
ncbi:MAG: hypothetical protein ABI112_09040, partial [Terracoccus sp.]